MQLIHVYVKLSMKAIGKYLQTIKGMKYEILAFFCLI